jgi:hypothetical protein
MGLSSDKEEDTLGMFSEEEFIGKIWLFILQGLNTL